MVSTVLNVHMYTSIAIKSVQTVLTDTMTNRNWLYCKNITASPFGLQSLAKAAGQLGPSKGVFFIGMKAAFAIEHMSNGLAVRFLQ